jgi:hypothetical protein
MSKARSLAALVRGADGKLHVFGGLGFMGLEDTHESYDATANAWTLGAAKSSVKRYALAAAAAPSGEVYVVGGTSNGMTPIGTAEIYSPKDDSFTSIADLPTPRLGLAAAATSDGRIFTIGGRDMNGAPTDTVEIWSPDTKTWTTGPSMPTKRLALAAAAIDGKIFAIAGRDAKNTPLAVVEVLDVAAGTWSIAAPLADARYWLGATASTDGNLYVAGGLDMAGFVQSAESLAPGSTWKALAALPEARGWASAASLADGRVLLVGGSTDDTVATQPPPLKSAVEYDPKKGAWGP